MSIIDEIESLEMPQPKESNREEYLEDALLLYHQMINLGLLKPRENQIQQTYLTMFYRSN